MQILDLVRRDSIAALFGPILLGKKILLPQLFLVLTTAGWRNDDRCFLLGSGLQASGIWQRKHHRDDRQGIPGLLEIGN
jgi:hypothetical protein